VSYVVFVVLSVDFLFVVVFVVVVKSVVFFTSGKVIHDDVRPAIGRTLAYLTRAIFSELSLSKNHVTVRADPACVRKGRLTAWKQKVNNFVSLLNPLLPETTSFLTAGRRTLASLGWTPLD
jgi:hypothetical protein